jgi:hypothetical protein
MTKIAGSGYASGPESGSISQRHGSVDPDPDPDPHKNGSAILLRAQAFLNFLVPYCIFLLRNVIGVRYVSVIIEERRGHADFESLFRTSDPDPRPFGTDPDSWIRTLIADPALFYGDFQDANKHFFSLQIYWLITVLSAGTFFHQSSKIGNM